MNKIALIAGEGDLPVELYQACQARYAQTLVLQASQGEHFKLQHTQPLAVNKDNLQEIIVYLKKEQVSDLVFAGKVDHRMLFTKYEALRLPNKAISAQGVTSHGDNSYFAGIVQFAESFGFRVVGIHELLKDAVVPKKLLTQTAPSPACQSDIELGFAIAKQIGALDIGQSIVLENGYVLGVEAIEGTDNLLKRCQEFKSPKREGVLIKVRKKNQELRIDMPVIGLTTLKHLFAAGLAGVALEAGAALMINKEQVVKQADELGLFILGV